MNVNFDEKDRKEFLIQMYIQLSNEIDRHIRIIWQIVGVLISAFAIFALVEKEIISIDLASSILIAVCGLSTAIVVESNFWYNRNLTIIANIERQFLKNSDSKDIHYYFTKHRKNNAYLDMMIIQFAFIFLLLIIVVVFHFSKQIYPFMHCEGTQFSPIKSIPYLVLLIGVFFILYFHNKRISDYNNFVENSPGIQMDANSDFQSNKDHIT